jgi:hypothetical protein
MLGHRWKLCKDSACGVGNSYSPKYEVLLVFYLFLCVSLNVLVSFYRNYYKNSKSSLTHSNLHTEMIKIQGKLHI